MTPEPTAMLQMFKRIAVGGMLGFAVVAAFPGIDSIPNRYTGRAGKLILKPGLEIEMVKTVAGFWASKQLTLQKDGRTQWSGRVWNSGIGTGCDTEECEFVRVDLDGNGRPEWLALFVPRGFGAASSYGENWDGTYSWSDEESRLELQKPWDHILCAGVSGLIVLDDEKTVYAFTYYPAPDPIAHRNPFVQGRKHYQMVTSGQWKKDRLSVTDPIPPQIWKAVRQLIETRACNTPDKITKQALPVDQRINWSQPPEPYGLNWRDYFMDGLAMYGRAKTLYERSNSDLPAKDRGTSHALAMFDLHAFFETFPFDEIDPENKSTEYTAMINDFAFYQMAPQDATEAVGFENQRKPVEAGVVAMLAQVIRRDPKRTSAYLNLGDALWRNSKDAQAAEYYRQYIQLMTSSGQAGHVPKRAVRRAGS